MATNISAPPRISAVHTRWRLPERIRAACSGGPLSWKEDISELYSSLLTEHAATGPSETNHSIRPRAVVVRTPVRVWVCPAHHEGHYCRPSGTTTGVAFVKGIEDDV
eukprot:1362511-Amorphochlora_amoeboformis.AAC.1